MNIVWLYVNGKCICSIPYKEAVKTALVLKRKGFDVQLQEKV